ncbi:copper resistance CopC family protein [Mycetocola spongiae]|uniref:copper resistance CopC family protein n=1 Tax=Mycetocola spongiae TaxID=2859226 RepID=UPI001CF0D88E|nr:copper resistance CopC family protein [Mycetocola spongiae]UCR87946.1 copper resistance protein CopC [Mycetocola spongiae]
MTMPFSSRRTRPLALAALALALLAPLLMPSPAMAHDQLLTSTPGENAVLDTAPAEVALTFSDSVLTVGAVVMVVDSGDRDWVREAPTLSGSSVTATLNPEMPEGHYEIKWRVVSSDGHPISGVVPFNVGHGEPEPAAPPEPVISPSAEPVASPAPAAEAGAFAPGSPLRLAAFGLGGALLAGAIALLVARVRRTRRPH